MTDSLTVIFCGQVRNHGLFLRSIDNLWQCGSGHYRVDRIVFSTWKGEISNYRGLREELLNRGVDLIEIDDPFHIPTGLGNIDRQMIALHWGLTLCPPRGHVFRTRADLGLNAHPEIGLVFEDYFHGVRESRLRNDEDFRVWIGSCSVVTPFFMQDRFFMGSKESLSQMANFRNDIPCLSNPAANVPEIRWFGGALLSRYPFISQILSLDWLSGERYRPEFFDSIAHLPFTRAALINYYKIVDRHFWIGSDHLSLEKMAAADLQTTQAELPYPRWVFDQSRKQIMEKCGLTEAMLDPEAPMRQITLEMIEEVDSVLRRAANGVRPGIPKITHGSFKGEPADDRFARLQARLLYGLPLHAGQSDFMEFSILDERERDRGWQQTQLVHLVYRWLSTEKELKRGRLSIDMNAPTLVIYPKIEMPDIAGQYQLEGHLENDVGEVISQSFSYQVCTIS